VQASICFFISGLRNSLQKAKLSVHNLKATNQCTYFSRIMVLRFEKFLRFFSLIFAESPFRVASSEISNLADSLSTATEEVEEEESFPDSFIPPLLLIATIPLCLLLGGSSSSSSDSAGLLLCFVLQQQQQLSF
jgi:hypothetical protein